MRGGLDVDRTYVHEGHQLFRQKMSIHNRKYQLFTDRTTHTSVLKREGVEKFTCYDARGQLKTLFILTPKVKSLTPSNFHARLPTNCLHPNSKVWHLKTFKNYTHAIFTPKVESLTSVNFFYICKLFYLYPYLLFTPKV